MSERIRRIQIPGRVSRRGIALFLLCLAHLMCMLDLSIVNIAIPSIQKELHLATSSLQWVISAYVLTYGGFLLVGGRLGDLFGRKRVLLTGLCGFLAASALGGFSTQAATLWAARALQGLSAAVITPTVMSFLTGLFAEGNERNRALSILGAVSGAGFILGLLLGGLLTGTVGWRWIFFLNLPIGLLVMVPAFRLLPETPREEKPIDLPGAVLATSALATLTYALAGRASLGQLSGRTLAPFLAAAVLLGLLIRVERRAEHPLIPRGLLEQPSLLRAALAACVFGAVIGPISFFLTLYLQNISALTPLQTGMVFLPQEAIVLLTATLAGRFASRFGTRNVIVAGMLCFGAGSFWLLQISPLGGYLLEVLPAMLLMGLGICHVVVAGTISATEGIPVLQHGIASGIWNTGIQAGTALGLATLTTLAGAQAGSLLQTAGIDPTTATVHGYRVAIAAAGGIALVGCLGQISLGRRPRTLTARDRRA